MITGTIRFLLTNFPLTFFLASLSCALIKVYRHRINITKVFIVEAFITNYFLWCLGISLIYNGIMRIAFSAMAANSFDGANSSFQPGIGIAGLGLGIASLLTYKKGYHARLIIVIATSVFLWICSGMHLFQISPANAPPVLWIELLQPIISIIVLIASRSFGKNESLFLINNSKTFFITVPVSK